eukprot:jgi/Chrpa1/21163/Chrysochromulina_OHIO_Genome00024670-RA
MERLEVRTDAARTEGAMSFEALGVSVPGVAANLAAANITAPNALQRATFGPISSGRDAIIHAWTGSGKTLAFLLPLFELLDASSREPQALVLCQSRELAFQIARVAELALAGTGLGVAAVVGGANPNNQLEKIKKNRPQLIVGTPGRVNDLAFEWQKLKLQRVRHIVIDEVDDALRPPHLEPTLRLIESAQDGRPLQLIFASATADTAAVRRAATQLLRKPMLVRLLPAAGVASDAAAQLPEGITHGLCVVEERKVLETMKSLYHSQPAPKCLLFVNSPHRVKIVCEKLWDSYGIPAEPLYGDQEREERVEVMRKLLDGRCRMAVTTEMGARGLDLPGLTHVVNLELPTDVSHYVHRAGRCGRAGAPGTVLSVVPQNKAFVVTKLANALGVPLHQMMIKGGEIAEIAPGARRGGGGGGWNEPDLDPMNFLASDSDD